MMHDSAPVFAAILAAGSSCRMGRDKLSLSFGGKSPVELSIEAFSVCPINIEGIIIAASAANTEAVKALCSRYEKVHVIAGGASRGESAHNCVKEAQRLSVGRKAVIAIHDAARCLVDSGTICRAVEAAFAHGSGIAGEIHNLASLDVLVAHADLGQFMLQNQVIAYRRECGTHVVVFLELRMRPADHRNMTRTRANQQIGDHLPALHMVGPD